jgi:phosphoketolase
VTQAMAELRRPTPSAIAMFTAGALEQGRNGWTHQRPEVEAYIAAMMRTGNVYPLFPCDANAMQAAYAWALGTHNKGIAIFGSKTPLPVYTTLDQAEAAVEEGATVLRKTAGTGAQVVLATAGDMVLMPVLEAADDLARSGFAVRVVSVVNPRRLYRPSDVHWETAAEPDPAFMDEARFNSLFDGDILLGVSGGPAATLEPVLLRSRALRRDLLSWKRGETTASPAELMAFNALDAKTIASRVRAMAG